MCAPSLVGRAAFLRHVPMFVRLCIPPAAPYRRRAQTWYILIFGNPGNLTVARCLLPVYYFIPRSFLGLRARTGSSAALGHEPLAAGRTRCSPTHPGRALSPVVRVCRPPQGRKPRLSTCGRSESNRPAHPRRCVYSSPRCCPHIIR